MRTNIEIDDKLLKQVMKIAGVKTKKAAVEYALSKMVRIQRQSRIKDLVGKIEFHEDVLADRDANSVLQPSSRRKAA